MGREGEERRDQSDGEIGTGRRIQFSNRYNLI